MALFLPASVLWLIFLPRVSGLATWAGIFSQKKTSPTMARMGPWVGVFALVCDSAWITGWVVISGKVIASGHALVGGFGGGLR